MRRLIAVLTLAFTLGLFITGCDSGLTGQEASPDGAASASMQKSNAPFKNFHQGFNHDAEPWSQFTKQGESWCGTIERKDRGDGDIDPSAGRGYAVIAPGRCIDVFKPVTSAPASGPYPPLLSSVWPSSGFVHQIDVYLEPSYPAGADGPNYEGGETEGLVYAADGDLVPSDEDAVITYATSLCVLNEDGSCPLPDGLRYFAIAVTRNGEGLDVAGHTVTEPGWYTFRYVFGSDEDGTLTVDFQLIDDGRALVTEPVEETFIGHESTSSFEVADLGSGYLWFTTIADGLELPIDEYRLRRGK